MVQRAGRNPSVLVLVVRIRMPPHRRARVVHQLVPVALPAASETESTRSPLECPATTPESVVVLSKTSREVVVGLTA